MKRRMAMDPNTGLRKLITPTLVHDAWTELRSKKEKIKHLNMLPEKCIR